MFLVRDSVIKLKYQAAFPSRFDKMRQQSRFSSHLTHRNAKVGQKLKFTIFGLTISSAWGNGHATPYRGLLRALHRRGHQINFYEKDVPYYARHRDFSSCDFYNLVRYSTWDETRHRVLGAAAESDVVMVASYSPT